VTVKYVKSIAWPLAAALVLGLILVDPAQALRVGFSSVQVRRQSIEIVVDQADGIPTMIGEKLTQMASEKSAEPPQEQKTEPGQTLYF